MGIMGVADHPAVHEAGRQAFGQLHLIPRQGSGPQGCLEILGKTQRGSSHGRCMPARSSKYPADLETGTGRVSAEEADKRS